MTFNKQLSIGFLALFAFYLPNAFADDSIAQSIQIYTHFKKIVNHPSWLLELRDVTSGQVFPYLFDIESNDNFWIAFSKEHDYQIIASEVKFGNASVIHNFCHLESNILRGKSIFVSLTGTISPNRYASECHVEKYSDTHFVIVKPEPPAPPPAPIQNAAATPTQNATTPGAAIPVPAKSAATPASATPTNSAAAAASAKPPTVQQSLQSIAQNPLVTGIVGQQTAGAAANAAGNILPAGSNASK